MSAWSILASAQFIVLVTAEGQTCLHMESKVKSHKSWKTCHSSVPQLPVESQWNLCRFKCCFGWCLIDFIINWLPKNCPYTSHDPIASLTVEHWVGMNYRPRFLLHFKTGDWWRSTAPGSSQNCHVLSWIRFRGTISSATTAWTASYSSGIGSHTLAVGSSMFYQLSVDA